MIPLTTIKADTQIQVRTIAHFVGTGQKAGLDSAAQSALIAFDEEAHYLAKRKLTEQYKVGDAEAAINSLLRFHHAFTEKMDNAATLGSSLRLSSTRVHQFYSLMHDMLDLPSGIYKQQRGDIEKSLQTLKLPPPLSQEQLIPNIGKIIATSSPSFVPMKIR